MRILATVFNALHSAASFFSSCVCVCIALIYILTRFKSTPLSAMIITHLIKECAECFLHLRRAAAGVAHRRPANRPQALPGIQTAPAFMQSHYLPVCNGAFLLDFSLRGNSTTTATRRSIAFGIGRTGDKRT